MRKCGFDNGGKCQLLNVETTNNCHCPYYRTEIQLCDFCGKPILSGGVFENGKLFCDECGRLLGTCHTCRVGKECAFETDPSPVPKVIQQTVNQGNIRASMPVKNPSRIAITCKNGCACYDEENGCLREISNCCGKWEMG